MEDDDPAARRSTGGADYRRKIKAPRVEIYPNRKRICHGRKPHELTFVNNDKGEVTAVIVRFPGIPVREGKNSKQNDWRPGQIHWLDYAVKLQTNDAAG